MKILLISGSPRIGNTEKLLTKIYNDLECDKELILLREKKINHCIGCLTCHSTYECIIKDNMQEIIVKMKQADIIIFGVPNYFDNVTSLFKTFIDRCHPLYKSEELMNKKVFYIFIGGGKIEGTRVALSNALKGFNKYLKLNIVGSKTLKALNRHDLEITKELDTVSQEIKKLILK